MLEYLEENKALVEELIQIDERIMKEKVPFSLLWKTSSIVNSYPSLKNTLIFYDGNPCTTIKLMNSNIENCILYPNRSFLATNKFLVHLKEDIVLATENNDFKYQKAQEVFDYVVVIGDKGLFENLKSEYQNIQYIEEK